MIPSSVDDLIIGTSDVVRNLREHVRRAALRSTPVLIEGPTGAGKELVARGLHAESGRHGRFVGFNAAAVPESLFESELLGHVRGAFSGAVRDRAGLLRSARNGTAFIDEIVDLSPPSQAKLLRVLDGHEVSAVGSDVSETVDFRLVTATNIDLGIAVEHGRFRRDLLYRLRGIVIAVPALRDHPEDIIPLVRHFARCVASASNSSEIRFTPAALRCLEAYHWPGNVRELRYAVEHASFIAADGGTVDQTHLEKILDCPRGSDTDAALRLESARRQFLEVLAVHAGDVNAVARALGIDRSTVYRRMRRLGLTNRVRDLKNTYASSPRATNEAERNGSAAEG